MSPIVLDIVSVISLIVLLSCGAFFSAAEMAFSSLSRARINSLAEGGGKRGRRAQLVVNLYETRFDELISTLLICNNFVAITSATVSAALFVRLIPEYGYIISTFVISAIVIVFTDILPKSMTKEEPERVAIFSAPVARILMVFFMPINKGIIKFKNNASAAFSSKDEEADAPQTLLEQELIFMVEEAETDGIINEDDSTLITNAIEFNEVSVGDVITPRVNIACIPINASVEDVSVIFLENGYSRMPVVEDSIDTVRGIVHLRDFIKCMATSASENPVTLEDIITPAVYTVTSAPITDVLTMLKKEKSHMAIVADEYGGTEGLVTMEDILECLVGEIFDENDEIVEEFLELDENKHKVLGTADIDRMFEYFDMEAESESNTVSGWIMDILRRVPEVDDSFTFEKLIVTVTKTDGRRAEECEITVVEEKQETPEESPIEELQETTV
ncbi:MAG: hemolysin family protein [Defluviitaleaceae bacterium]|nr:hemolysin family protein [Defluviitaleaceae bacterium]